MTQLGIPLLRRQLADRLRLESLLVSKLSPSFFFKVRCNLVPESHLIQFIFWLLWMRHAVFVCPFVSYLAIRDTDHNKNKRSGPEWKCQRRTYCLLHCCCRRSQYFFSLISNDTSWPFYHLVQAHFRTLAMLHL